MKKMYFYAAVLLLAASVLAVPCVGLSDDYGKKAGLEEKLMKKFRFLFENKEEIGITPEQENKLKDLKIKLKKDLVKKNADIDLVKIDVSVKFKEETIDMAAINELLDKKYSLKKEKASLLYDTYAKVKALMTGEQKEKAMAVWNRCEKEKKERCPHCSMMKGHMSGKKMKMMK